MYNISFMYTFNSTLLEIVEDEYDTIANNEEGQTIED